MENAYSHPTTRGGSPSAGPAAVETSSSSGVHGRSNSLQNLARLPGVARGKLRNLAQNPFVKFIEDSDGQDKDENDIYRQHVRGCWRLAGLLARWLGPGAGWIVVWACGRAGL